ncbi:hypothetical protein ES705_46291 [subsurface metagenome]
MTDARVEDGAPFLAGPVLRHPNPAGAVFIPLSFPVPVELHFDAAVVIDIYFLTRGPHHQGRLATFHQWFRSGSGRTEHNLERDAGESVGINGPFAFGSPQEAA